MDKDQLEILERQDKYSTRMFILSCVLAFLVFASIINNNLCVDKMSKTFENTMKEVVRIDAEKEMEQVRLYFETDYDYGEVDNSVEQKVEVNN